MYGCTLRTDPQRDMSAHLARGRPTRRNSTSFSLQWHERITRRYLQKMATTFSDSIPKEEDDISQADGGIFEDSVIDDSGIVVMVIGGVGNEPSGSVAATHIQRHYRPKRGTIVVVDRANAQGLSHSTRYIKGAKNGENDLNRNFPVDSSVPPRTPRKRHMDARCNLST